MLVRRDGSDEYFFPMSSDGAQLDTNFAIGWPAEQILAGDMQLWAPRLDISARDLQPFIADSLDGWVALRVRWLAPTAHVGSSGRAMLACVALGEPEPLLKCAARRAFHGLGKQALCGLGGKLGAEVRWDMKVFDLVLKLVEFALPSLSDQELMAILALRCPMESAWSHWLQSEDADALMVDQKNDDGKEALKEIAEKEGTADEYKAAFAQHRTALTARSAHAAAANAKKKRGPKPAPAAKAVRLPTRAPELMDSTTENELQASLPPGFRVFKDTFNCRWQLSHAGQRVLSGSWGLYGYVGSGLDIVRGAWDRHHLLGGELPIWLQTGSAVAGQKPGAGNAASSSSASGK